MGSFLCLFLGGLPSGKFDFDSVRPGGRKVARMIKFVYCVRKRPEIPVAEFQRYWREKHGPLVKQYAAALRAKRYVQSHTLDTELNRYAQLPRGTAEAYDGITEVWWESEADLLAALQSPEGQGANKILAEDEGRFVDLARSSVFFTQEHPIF